MELKRTFLWGVLGAAVTAGALGVWVLLFERFFGVEEEVFASLGSVLLFCLPATSCAATAERGHWRGLMRLGMGWCVAGLGWYLVVVWFHGWLDDVLPESWLWKPMLLLPVWAAALPWMGMVTVRGGRSRWVGLVQRATVALVLALALLLTVMILGEIESDALLTKGGGTLGILAVLGTVTVMVLWRIEKLEAAANVESTSTEVSLTCPRCGLTQTVASGHSRCARCRLKFRVEVEEPRCPSCGYLLHMLERPECPECGAGFGREELGGAGGEG